MTFWNIPVVFTVIYFSNENPTCPSGKGTVNVPKPHAIKPYGGEELKTNTALISVLEHKYKSIS